MQKYRERSNIVEAVQFDPDVHPWPDGVALNKSRKAYIETDEGTAYVHATDWIVKGASGTLHVCKDAIFQSTYEPVEDERPTLKRHVLKRAVVNKDTFKDLYKGEMHEG